VNGSLGIGSAVDLFGSLETSDAGTGGADATELQGRDAAATCTVVSGGAVYELWFGSGGYRLQAVRAVPAWWPDPVGAASLPENWVRTGDTIYDCPLCHVICAI